MVTTLPESTFSTLEKDVENVLNEFEVYDIGSYGWLNADDEDPDMLGHAMWQIQQPWLDFDSVANKGKIKRRPINVEGHLLGLGEDFCGLMRTSRMSLGLTLQRLPQAKEKSFGENSFFWLHHMDTHLKLAIASDRLKDLLIVACTGKPPGDFRTTKRTKLYSTPFEDAADILRSRGIDDARLTKPLGALPTQGPALFDYISRRNEIVHESSTQMARFLRDTVNRQQKQFDLERTAGHKPEPPRAFVNVKERVVEARAELDKAVQELKAWYLLLVEASNNVFLIENRSRPFAS